MITLLNQFTEKHGIKVNDLFDKADVKDEMHKKCLMVISYMLFDVYELSKPRVAEIIKRGECTVFRHIKEVQDDFDYNNAKAFGQMFDELLGILEDGESKGIKIE